MSKNGWKKGSKPDKVQHYETRLQSVIKGLTKEQRVTFFLKFVRAYGRTWEHYWDENWKRRRRRRKRVEPSEEA